MDKKFDLETLDAYESLPKQRWTTPLVRIAMALWKMSLGFDVRIENLEALPRDEPVIVAMNHTHFFDFLPLRAVLYDQGYRFCSWVKARAYKDPVTGFLLERVGTVPLCSRGYILAADYHACFQERPSDEEYRALRDYVDYQIPLPDNARYATMLSRPRDILGWHFNPSSHTYRQAVRAIFYDLMRLSVCKTQRNVERGEHVHVYPQGSIAARLIPGKVGTAELALALGLPILPLGLSGARESFIGKSPLVRSKQEMVMRFGETLYPIPREEFPRDYRPFHPDDTDKQREKLQRHTDRVMEMINDLLEPECQWAPDLQSDAKTGVKRFF